MQSFGRMRNIGQNRTQQNLSDSLSGREKIAPSVISQSEELEKARKQLLPLPGVTILGPEGKMEDSGRLIRPSNPRRTIEIAMFQLQNEEPDSDFPVYDLIVNNNLGCAYTLLGRYQAAKQTLQEAIDKTNAEHESLNNSLAFETAEYNLSIVNNIVEGL